MRGLFAALILLCSLAIRAQDFALTLDSIDHPAFAAEGVQARFRLDRRGEVELRVALLRLGSTEYKDVTLLCADFALADGRIDCPRGSLRRSSTRDERPPLPFAFSYRMRDGRLEFTVANVDAVAWSPLLKRLRGWNPQGTVDLRLIADRRRAELQLTMRDLDFANKTGDVVGTGIGLTLSANAERSGAVWHWNAKLDWTAGDLALAPWRRNAGITVSAEGELSDTRLDVRLARLDVAGIGAVTATLDWDRERAEPRAWGLVTERLDLATAMREWLQPWLTQLGFPAWQLSGHVLFAADWHDGRLQRFFAGLEDAALADGTGYLALRGVNAHIPWEATAATEASFGIAAGQLGELPLGDFSFPMRLNADALQIDHLSAPMLDGTFVVERFRLALGAQGWSGEFAGGIDGVSMDKLTHALRLPRMAGNLTARIPRIAYADGVLALDGALSIEVFDGGIILHRLRILNPFAAERRFIADVTARRLDLGMLTRTFSWGAIEGRFDADLRDLEMQGWKPLSFVARINDSAGEFPRLVSLGALQDIVALGASDGSGLPRVPLRAGAGFGYAHIGFGCTLRAGVCTLEGVGRDGNGVVLVEGSGIPAVRIIGYNRRIDWDALVARVREVIAGKPGVLIE